MSLLSSCFAAANAVFGAWKNSSSLSTEMPTSWYVFSLSFPSVLWCHRTLFHKLQFSKLASCRMNSSDLGLILEKVQPIIKFHRRV